MDGRKKFLAGVGNHGEEHVTYGSSRANLTGSTFAITPDGNTWHSMSSDGKRVFMTKESFETRSDRELFMRENPEQTFRLLDSQVSFYVAGGCVDQSRDLCVSA